MRRKNFLQKFFPPYLLLALVTLLLSSWLIVRMAQRLYYDKASRELEVSARLLKTQFESLLPQAAPASLDSLCKSMGPAAGIRVTYVTSAGLVLGDSHEDPRAMENHSDRPEIQEALKGRVGSSIRYSPTLDKKLIYMALPVEVGGQILGVIRAALPAAKSPATLKIVYLTLALVCLIIVILGSFTSVFVLKSIERPLREIKKGAQRFARGEFGQKLHLPDTEELSGLAETLNQMAAQLDERIRSITQQRNELEAMLASMVEGVLVLDQDLRILLVNQTALKFLNLSKAEVVGKGVEEIILIPQFQKFVKSIFNQPNPLQEEIVIDQGRFYLQAHGTLIEEVGRTDLRALVVLNDLTQIRRLENIRRDFVANVSHELRTPITTIKGYVETLREGAILNPQEAENFLEIIVRHVDRLNNIISDLLRLSVLEQEAESRGINLERGNLLPVLQNAVSACQPKAQGKDLQLIIDTETDQEARINAPILEQAIDNLLDNAINYSEPGSRINLGVKRTGQEVILYVQDLGCGIAAEHLPRIFERFYRVDKNRSRKQGGTGLGLAIVKHIALAHQGRVSVESRVGQGSTFRIHLPAID